MSSYRFDQYELLEGKKLVLIKLDQEILPGLAEILVSPSTWFSIKRDVDTPEKFKENLSIKLEKQNRHECLTLVAVDKESQQKVAMSSYQYPTSGFERIEIGYTWIADTWMRSYVHTEMKYLMLTYAFETMRVQRVEFMVHPTNDISNRSMKRIGATYEGLLRKYRSFWECDDGDRNVYSIIGDEWPKVRSHIQGLMRNY
ncbi:MAG: GNAT family N-acetyltransferase [Pseudomonadota bacterium]|nr:GNAT family N-acetyltransferase [Pseudomonadota bacterium]